MVVNYSLFHKIFCKLYTLFKQSKNENVLNYKQKIALSPSIAGIV